MSALRQSGNNSSLSTAVRAFQFTKGPGRRRAIHTSTESGLQTSILTVEPETALGLSSSPSQQWSRASPADQGTNSVSGQEPSQGPGGNHVHLHIW